MLKLHNDNEERYDVFRDFYDFLQVDVVIMQHIFGQSIRASQSDYSLLDIKGDIGQSAQWLVRIDDSYNKEARLQNLYTTKYLRIVDEAQALVDGDGGQDCIFRFHRQSLGVFKLESKKFPGKFIVVDTIGIHIGNDNAYARFSLFTRGVKSPFYKPYLLEKKANVVIENPDAKFLGIKENSVELSSNLDRVSTATWDVEIVEEKQIRLKNLSNGKYLRIYEKIDGDAIDCDGEGFGYSIFKVHCLETVNEIKLESFKMPSRYVAHEGANIGISKDPNDNQRCRFMIYRK